MMAVEDRLRNDLMTLKMEPPTCREATVTLEPESTMVSAVERAFDGLGSPLLYAEMPELTAGELC